MGDDDPAFGRWVQVEAERDLRRLNQGVCNEWGDMRIGNPSGHVRSPKRT
jgi:hypothetical protein